MNDMSESIEDRLREQETSARTELTLLADNYNAFLNFGVRKACDQYAERYVKRTFPYNTTLQTKYINLYERLKR